MGLDLTALSSMVLLLVDNGGNKIIAESMEEIILG
jgi:hypothetical protein